jgi:hypothetical protein
MIASLDPRGIMSMASGVYMTLIRLRSTPAMVPVAHGRSGTARRAPGLARYGGDLATWLVVAI